MLVATTAVIAILDYVPGATELRNSLGEVVVVWLACIVESIYEMCQGGTLFATDRETGSSAEEPRTVEGQKPLLMEVGEGSTREERKRKAPIELSDFPPRLRSREDLIEVPGSPEEGARSTAEGSDHARDNREIAQVPAGQEAQQPVQQGVEAQHALSAARDEIRRLYVEDIVKRCTWMRSQRSELLLSPDIANNVRSMATDLELESMSAEELQGFIQGIRADPKLLSFNFREYWPNRK